MTDKPRIQVLEPLRYVIADVRNVDLGLDGTVDSFYREVEKRALSRGWQQLLLIDLPALGAVYDNGLSTGTLLLSKIPASFGKLHSGNFQDSWVYRTLLQHTFDGFGTLDATAPVEVVWATRQLLYLYKKANMACPQEGIVNAVKDYIHIEEDLRLPCGTWANDTWIPSSSSFSDSGSQELRDSGVGERYWRILDMVFRCLVPKVQLLPSGVVPKHGPGAVSDVRTGGDKYAFPYWPAKLGRLFPSPEFAYANEYLAIDTDDISLIDGLLEKEPAAKLIAVPKTYKGPRLIASEPTAHQFIQQGLMTWIRQNMPEVLRTSVNFQDQTPSRDAALNASLTGDLATVDLSSASDRLSCWVVERAFRSNQSLLTALHAARTRVVHIDHKMLDSPRELLPVDLQLKLKKFAAQGSAVTFPVQTIIYAGIAIAAVLYDLGKSIDSWAFKKDGWQVTLDNVTKAGKSVRVFGDDIVLPSSNVPTLAAALQALQLKVNGTKSHYLGHFRESCGMDAYRGHDVTPVYIGDLQPTPGAEALAAWIEVSNSFHKAGLWRTSRWMLDGLEDSILHNILYSDLDGPGIRAFTFCRGTRFNGATRQSLHRPYGPVRPNEGVQGQERRVLCIRAKAKKKARESWQSLLQFFLEDPSPETEWSSGYLAAREAAVCDRRWIPYDACREAVHVSIVG